MRGYKHREFNVQGLESYVDRLSKLCWGARRRARTSFWLRKASGRNSHVDKGGIAKTVSKRLLVQDSRTSETVGDECLSLELCGSCQKEHTKGRI